MTNTRQSDIQMIATALAEAGVERGSVGADNVRMAWAARIVDSGLLLRIRANAYSEGYDEGYQDGYDDAQ